jgi:hypothetical protein
VVIDRNTDREWVAAGREVEGRREEKWEWKWEGNWDDVIRDVGW